MDLPQADTSYYQVHNIWPITKRHVLLLVSTITIQKPREIFQVSLNKKNKKHAKCQSHTGMCKQWHKQSNQVLTCVTLKIKTFQPIKQCHVSWRKSLKAPPIMLWHVSSISLCHVSLTRPKIPINKSFPKAFLHTKTS